MDEKNAQALEGVAETAETLKDVKETEPVEDGAVNEGVSEQS